MNTPLRSSLVCAALLVALYPLSQTRAAEESAENPSAKWEPAIVAFEKLDARDSIKPGGVLFVGSSSIRLWKLAESFPELDAINRGFGGSQIVDSLHYADRIILPYKPRAVVIYAGDNDIKSGKSPEEVSGDYKQLAALIRKELPETKILCIPVKPSVARWNLIDKVRETNKLIRESMSGDERQVFIDIDPVMLGENGEPDPALFLKDGLHLNDLGYERWTKLVAPHLK